MSYYIALQNLLFFFLICAPAPPPPPQGLGFVWNHVSGRSFSEFLQPRKETEMRGPSFFGHFFVLFFGPKGFHTLFFCALAICFHTPQPRPIPPLFFLGPNYFHILFLCALFFTQSHWPLPPLGGGAIVLTPPPLYLFSPFFVCFFSGPSVFLPFLWAQSFSSPFFFLEANFFWSLLCLSVNIPLFSPQCPICFVRFCAQRSFHSFFLEPDFVFFILTSFSFFLKERKLK